MTDKNELPQEIVALLACPQTHAPLIYDRKNNELISNSAGLAYPVKDGIAIILPDEARKIQAILQ